MYEFSVTLTGQNIDARAFLAAIANAVKLLQSVDKNKSVRWRLSTLRYASPAVVGFAGDAKRRAVAMPEDIGRTIVSGLAALERGEEPYGFSDEAMEYAKKLSDVRGRGGIEGVVVLSQNGGTASPQALSAKTAATVEDLIGTKYLSYGSIIGRLELVSAHGGVMRCNVYERLSGKAVRCDVPPHRKREVIELFDQEVIVTGDVSRDKNGQARQIALISIQPADPISALPQSLAGIAPDYTEGADSVEYIKKRWQ